MEEVFFFGWRQSCEISMPTKEWLASREAGGFHEHNQSDPFLFYHESSQLQCMNQRRARSKWLFSRVWIAGAGLEVFFSQKKLINKNQK